MIEKTIHIGPAVGGGMGSVIRGYIKLFGLPKVNVWNSYNSGFINSLPLLISICFKILFKKQDNIICYHIHLAEKGSIIRKLAICLCLKLKNKKIIIHLHGGGLQKEYYKNVLIRILIKKLINISDAIICITENMKIFIEKENFKNKIYVIPNLCETIADTPATIVDDNKDIHIVYAGRYCERKGVYDLLAAFEKANFNNSVHLDLFGDREVEKVREVAGKSSKKHLITVYGWIEHSEYIEKLPKYDFLVLPSYAEVFPMSILESMGFGIPVISTYVGGIPEIIENKKNGILFNASNIDELVNALEKLANNLDLRTELGLNAWTDVKAKFSPEIILGKLEDVYAEFL